MKKFISIISATTLTATLLTGCGAGKTAMKAGDLTATQGDISMLTDAFLLQTGDFDAAKDAAVESFEDALKSYAAFNALGLELSEEENKQLKSGVANFKASFGSATEFKKAAKKAGANEDIFPYIIGQSLYDNALAEALEINEPTDEEAKNYFKENYLRAKHVLLLTDSGQDKDFIKERIDNILDRAKKGESFDELVKNFSEDPGSKSYPDGYVFTDGDMVDEFYDAAMSIQPGEFAMCESSYGYHVIQRLALDETPEKFTDFYEQNKTAVMSKAQINSLREAIDKTLEENGIAFEKYDDVINTIPSPTPTAEPTEEPIEESAEASETKTE